MSWCFQCGVAGKPEQAVGWDEDGEPACGLHRVKAVRPFNLEDVSRGSTHGLEPERVAEKSSPTIPAAPSPVQIKQEKEMEDKFCIVEGCGKKLRSDNNSGYCKPHRNEVRKVSVSPKPSKIRKNGNGSFTMAVKTPHNLPLGSGATESVFGVNHFTAGQLDRFWSLLSPVSKAEAIDRLLSYQPL